MPEIVKDICGFPVARFTIKEALEELDNIERLDSKYMQTRLSIEEVLKKAYPEGYLFSWEIVKLAYKLSMSDLAKWMLEDNITMLQALSKDVEED